MGGELVVKYGQPLGVSVKAAGRRANALKKIAFNIQALKTRLTARILQSQSLNQKQTQSRPVRDA